MKYYQYFEYYKYYKYSPEITHDITILPPTLHRTGTTQVRGRGRPIMDCTKSENISIRKYFKKTKIFQIKNDIRFVLQMPEFVCRHNDSRESSCVLHYGHTVHLHKWKYFSERKYLRRLRSSPSPASCWRHRPHQRKRSQRFLCYNHRSGSFVWNVKI